MIDDQEGFCMEDQNITYYKGVQQLQESKHDPQHLNKVRKNKLIAHVRNYDKKYVKILQQNEFINHQLRQKWITQISQKHSQTLLIYNNFSNQSFVDKNDNIQFDSKFQGGNLDLVFKVNIRSYQLYMRPDTNTSGHFQWFYFKIRNVQKNKTIKFSIMNFTKSNMLYNVGLRPYVFSNGKGKCWEQINQKVAYQSQQNAKYSLTFSYKLQFQNDEVSFASQPPYTYSMLSKFLETNIQDNIKYLCNSLLGFKIPKVEIFPALNKINTIAIAIARQHPGQAVSSWIMQGFIQKMLKSKSNKDIYWIIIPMVNSDGVFLGNNRTGVIGYDLNRCWNLEEMFDLNKKKEKFIPQIVSITELLKQLCSKFGKKIKMFIDFHGHSVREGIFSYGPPYVFSQNEKFIQARLFPQLIASKSPYFDLLKCGYRIPKQKKNAARAVFFQKYQIPFCYTIQTTFGLFKRKSLKTDDFIQSGKQIAEAALEFINFLSKNKSEQLIQTKNLFQKIKTSTKTQQITAQSDYSNSDDDQIDDIEIAQNFRENILSNIIAQQQNTDKETLQNKLKSRAITFQKLLIDNNHQICQINNIKRLNTLGSCNQNKKKQFRYFRYRQQDSKSNIKPIITLTRKLTRQKSEVMRQFSYPRKSESELQKMMILSNDRRIQQNLKGYEKKKKQQIKKREYRITKKSEILLNYLSKNKNNKIGNKMLIINEL